MGIHKLDNIAGFYNPYVGVKCLDCVKKKDWDERLRHDSRCSGSRTATN